MLKVGYLWIVVQLEFSGQIFSAYSWHSNGHKLRPLLADLFLFGHEAELIQGLLKRGKKHLAQKFNFTYRYIDDVLSLNNSKISEFIDLIYPCELEILDATESNTSVSYLGCYLCFGYGKFVTGLRDKRDELNFHIVKFNFSVATFLRLHTEFISLD